jgi:hypothetical protein
VAGSCKHDNEPSGFREILPNFLLNERLVASKEVLNSMRLGSYEICSG